MSTLDTLALLAFALGAIWPLSYWIAHVIAFPILAWREAKWKIEERKRTHVFRKTKKETYF